MPAYSNLALAHEIVEDPQRFLHRVSRIVTVAVENVHVIESKKL
jgi:hypothetical protein